MNYSLMDPCLQALLTQAVPLSSTQRQRIRQFCSCVLLAGSVELPQMARWLAREGQHAARVQWLRRVLTARFITQEGVYQNWLRYALRVDHPTRWHLVIDRTSLVGRQVDLLSIGLAYRKRAIPLVWQQIPYGGVGVEAQIALVKRVQALVPDSAEVLVHGDAEFGAMPLLTHLRAVGWHFILGQRDHYQCWQSGHWCALRDLPFTTRDATYLADVTLTKQYRVGGVTLFGFRDRAKGRAPKRRFFATSLPIAHTLRQLGKRRWSIECCFKDFKSSGWHMTTSHLTSEMARERLLVLLSTCYVWATCLGRWLCKTGQRRLLEGRSQRQRSLFRIGWDWLVHQFRMQQPIPHLLRLYA